MSHCNFHENTPEKRNTLEGNTSPVVIGDNVWLGSRVMVLNDVSIANHSVIAAGSIVTELIPERSFAAGSSAKVLCSN